VVPHYQTWWKRTKAAKPTERDWKISKKSCSASMKITNFDRQAALFNGASMGANT
jgi:hypothetical protein